MGKYRHNIKQKEIQLEKAVAKRRKNKKLNRKRKK